MKKLSSLIMILAILFSFSACAEVTLPVRVAALKGPTAMGMAYMYTENEASESAVYEFTIAGSADLITADLIQGKLDIAAVPANLASILYNNSNGAVKVLAINTLGVLYIVERGEAIHSVEDLKGKTIYSSGKGSTPEYALNYILQKNGLEPGKDVFIEYKSEHSECLAAILQDNAAIAMLPQPFATTAQTKAEDIRIALNLSEEWEKLSDVSTMITGVVVANSAWLNDNRADAVAFLKDYATSVSFVNENTAEAAKMIGNMEIVTAEVAEKALPYCNITYIVGDEMKEKLSGYLSVLYEQDAQSVGGKLPDEGFYFAE